MPCTYIEGPDDFLRRDLKAATQVACELVYALKQGKTIEELSEATRIWVIKHEKEDVKRAKEVEVQHANEIAELKRDIERLQNKYVRLTKGKRT